jgi:hypothetical protein
MRRSVVLVASAFFASLLASGVAMVAILSVPEEALAAFSGKNGRIAFGHIFRTVEGDDPEIYTILPDGSGLHQVTRNSKTSDGAPAW